MEFGQNGGSIHKFHHHHQHGKTLTQSVRTNFVLYSQVISMGCFKKISLSAFVNMAGFFLMNGQSRFSK
jgi:hypothetical protein